MSGRRCSIERADRSRALIHSAILNSAVYDAASRVISSVDPLGHVSTTVYDQAGRPVASVDPLGNVSSIVYDAASRRIASVDPLGNITSTLYDAASRRVASVDPLANRTSYGFDQASRPVSTTNAHRIHLHDGVRLGEPAHCERRNPWATSVRQSTTGQADPLVMSTRWDFRSRTSLMSPAVSSRRSIRLVFGRALVMMPRADRFWSPMLLGTQVRQFTTTLGGPWRASMLTATSQPRFMTPLVNVSPSSTPVGIEPALCMTTRGGRLGRSIR